ncbi:MAG: hypothetical protein K6347_00485, partial [Campylobacterales bacterium]
RRLGWLFAALALMILLIGVVTMQQMMVIIAQDKALAISEVVKAGLTAHMKNGIMDRRDYFLNEIKSLHNIRELAIIRSEAVNRQFGAGGQEKEIDHISREVFGQKRPRYLFDNLLLSSSPTIQAYIPYIASDEGALNCLMCHQVTKGEVLGVVAITLDLSDYYTIIGIGALELQAAALFIVLIVGALWLATTLRRHVMVPLRRLQANL